MLRYLKLPATQLLPQQFVKANNKERIKIQHCTPFVRGFNGFPSQRAATKTPLCKGRDQPKYAPSQWEPSLQCNDVSHWVGAYLDWFLQGPVMQKAFPCYDITITRNTYRVWLCDVFLSQHVLLISFRLIHWQGSTYPIARWPRASKTTSRASGFQQSFLLYYIQADWKKCAILEVGLVKNFWICQALGSKAIAAVAVIQQWRLWPKRQICQEL